MIVLYRKGGGLRVVLKVRKPENSIFLQRATKSETRLFSGKKWIWILEVSMKAGIGGHIVISIEQKCGAMEIIGAMATNDINSANATHRGRRIKAKSLDLKLLDGFLREVLSGPPIHSIIHCDPIDRNLGLQVLSSRH